MDHATRTTSWVDPRDAAFKPAAFAECLGDELPYGWETAVDPDVGLYYINHNTWSTQLDDPRLGVQRLPRMAEGAATHRMRERARANVASSRDSRLSSATSAVTLRSGRSSSQALPASAPDPAVGRRDGLNSERALGPTTASSQSLELFAEREDLKRHVLQLELQGRQERDYAALRLQMLEMELQREQARRESGLQLAVRRLETQAQDTEATFRVS